MSNFKVGDIVKSHVTYMNGRRGTVIKVYYGTYHVSFENDALLYRPMFSHELTLIKKFDKKQVAKATPKRLYAVSTDNGIAAKGIIPAIKSRGFKGVGKSPTQALSAYEDVFGKQLDPNESIVWVMTPHKLRKQANGKYRIGREIK